MRFVSPETARLELPDTVTTETVEGESREVRAKNWIEVKKMLTAGEEKRYRAAGFGRVSQRADVAQPTAGDAAKAKNEIDVDWTALAFARALAYVVDWSEKRKFDADSLQALHPDDFKAIDDAILAHIDAMDAEKKPTAGSPRSTARSA